MNLLGFFDYKTDGYQSEMFKTGHIVYMILTLLLLIILPIALRKVSHKKISIYLKVTAIVVPITDLIKIIWETYHYYPIHGTFEFQGLLPLYLCSLFIYTMPFAAFGKGKGKDFSLAFITTVGIVGGLSNVFYLNILNYYPLFHYASFTSIFYHIMMSFTGLWLLTSKYYVLDKYCSLKAFIPIILLSLIAIPVNYIFDGDYMLLKHAYGVPFLPALANLLHQYNIEFIFIFIMFGVYIGVGYFIYGIYKLFLKFQKEE